MKKKKLGDYIGVEGCKYLSQALKLNNSINQINLGCKFRIFQSVFLVLFKKDNDIKSEGCKYLVDALRTNGSIQELNLNS